MRNARELEQEYAWYNRLMPMQIGHVNGGDFPYRYYRNPEPNKDVTLIFLAGGTGLGDSAFLFCRSIVARYSLLTFNYPQAFKTNGSLADALAELLTQLKTAPVYLVGQSYGGLFAQVMAKRHPQKVKGLLLSGTCSMYNDLTYSGITDIVTFINPRKQQRNLRVNKLLPQALLLPVLKLAFRKAAPTKETSQYLACIAVILKESINKKYWYHMDLLLGDLMNEFGTHKPEDFAAFHNEVLLLFPDHDAIFSQELKEAFIRLMPESSVVQTIAGGHLALLENSGDYLNRLYTFIDERNG